MAKDSGALEGVPDHMIGSMYAAARAEADAEDDAEALKNRTNTTVKTKMKTDLPGTLQIDGAASNSASRSSSMVRRLCDRLANKLVTVSGTSRAAATISAMAGSRSDIATAGNAAAHVACDSGIFLRLSHPVLSSPSPVSPS